MNVKNSAFLDYPVIILAGGLGTRLRGHIGNIPKPLAPIANKPFLHYLLQDLYNQGFHNIVLSCHHLVEHFTQFLETSELKQSMDIRLVVEPTLLGTGGAVKHCIETLKITTPFFVCNGDTLIPGGLSQLNESIDDHTSSWMGVIAINNPDRFGVVEFDKENFVTGFFEKRIMNTKQFINAGIYFFSPQVFQLSTPFSLEKEILPSLSAKHLLRAQPIISSFIDIGIPSDYDSLNDRFQN